MASLNQQLFILRNRQHVHSAIDGEVIIMNVDLGEYYGMDKIASDIWQRIEQPVTVGDLVKHYHATYSGDTEEIENDIYEFLQDMTDKGLITLADSAP